MTSDASQFSSADELRSLVLEAFRRARRTGKPDWYQMRTAVLKNRMLNITARHFRESDFGAERFSDLIPMLSDVVSFDTSTKPPVVELLPEVRAALEGEERTTTEEPSRTRVRADLWNAVLDFSTGVAWRWNAGMGRAEPVDEAEVLESERLPTIRPSDLAQWRQAFIEEHHDDLSEDAMTAAIEWAKRGRRSEMLPQHLKGQWFEYLKKRVVERVESWFADRHLQIPSDLLEQRPLRGQRPTDQVQALRDFIIRCVRTMSASELASLQLPASAALRTRGER